jgi:hypothetical protein
MHILWQTFGANSSLGPGNIIILLHIGCDHFFARNMLFCQHFAPMLWVKSRHTHRKKANFEALEICKKGIYYASEPIVSIVKNNMPVSRQKRPVYLTHLP